MDKSRKSKIIISVLSVLLAVSLVALGFAIYKLKSTEGKNRSDGNVIGGGSTASGTLNVVSFSFLTDGTEEKLSVTENGAVAQPFNIVGMVPGDTVSKSYVVKINDDTANTLYFGAEFTDKTVYGQDDIRKTRDASLLNITVKIGDTELYNGAVANISEKTFPVSSLTEVKYDISVSLDKTAGNEFADLDLSMKFIWKMSYEDSVTVTYEDGVEESEIFATQSYKVKKGSPTPSFNGTPEREGYVFDKWTPSVSETAIENVTYKATWIKRHKVTFSYDGKTSEVFVNDKTAVSKIYAPKKTWHGFAGWYLDDKYTEKYDFTTPVTGDLTLYGRFFLWGDVNCDGTISAFDADLINLYIMEVDNPSIKNIMAGMVSNITGTISSNDANFINLYVMESIDEFPVEKYVGYEYDLENGIIIPPVA